MPRRAESKQQKGLYLPRISQVDSLIEAIEIDGLGGASSDRVVCVTESVRFCIGPLFLTNELHVEAILRAQHMRHADGRRLRCQKDVLAGVLLETLGNKSAECCQHARELRVINIEVYHPQIIVFGYAREVV